jgi:hypothetical protein
MSPNNKYLAKLLNDHLKNKKIISNIYYVVTIISLLLSTVTTFLLGSKSINDIDDKITLASFVLNILSTCLITAVNSLQLETKITKHKHTIKEIEDLFINYTIEQIDENNEIVKEKISMINDHRPDLCF